MVRWGTVSIKIAQELGTLSALRLLAWQECAWCRWISQAGRARFCPLHAEGAMQGEARSEATGTKRWLVRRDAGRDVVEVMEVAPGRAEYITPGRSQKVFNHSPDGFEFGYMGSGPAQLALAILLRYFDGTPNLSDAVRLHNAFMCDFLTDKQCGEFEITAGDIAAWLARRVS